MKKDGILEDRSLKARFFSLPLNPELKLTVDKQLPQLFKKKAFLNKSPAT